MIDNMAYNRAYDIAERAHAGVKRTGSDEWYITHPVAVAQMLINYGRPLHEVILGLLHDVIEDAKPELRDGFIREIEVAFGYQVLSDLKYVTKISRKEDGNRLTRVKIDIYHYVSGPAASHNVKIADVLHNLSDVDTLDPGFAKKYVMEKHMLISEFEKNGKADKEMLGDVRRLIDSLLGRFK